MSLKWIQPFSYLLARTIDIRYFPPNKPHSVADHNFHYFSRYFPLLLMVSKSNKTVDSGLLPDGKQFNGLQMKSYLLRKKNDLKNQKVLIHETESNHAINSSFIFLFICHPFSFYAYRDCCRFVANFMVLTVTYLLLFSLFVFILS